MRTRSTIIAAIAVLRGEADAMIWGVEGKFASHLKDIRDTIGLAPNIRDFPTLNLLIMPNLDTANITPQLKNNGGGSARRPDSDGPVSVRSYTHTLGYRLRRR